MFNLPDSSPTVRGITDRIQQPKRLHLDLIKFAYFFTSNIHNISIKSISGYIGLRTITSEAMSLYYSQLLIFDVKSWCEIRGIIDLQLQAGLTYSKKVF